MSVTVRYFASARAAAGVDEESAQGATVGAVLDEVGRTRPELHRIVGISSYLLDGATAERDTPVLDGQRIDVLPPFAGG